MPTKIERSCVEQAYVLADSFTRNMVLEGPVAATFGPVTVAPGCGGAPCRDRVQRRNP